MLQVAPEQCAYAARGPSTVKRQVASMKYSQPRARAARAGGTLETIHGAWMPRVRAEPHQANLPGQLSSADAAHMILRRTNPCR
jgi:hypothetical protein